MPRMCFLNTRFCSQQCQLFALFCCCGWWCYLTGFWLTLIFPDYFGCILGCHFTQEKHTALKPNILLHFIIQLNPIKSCCKNLINDYIANQLLTLQIPHLNVCVCVTSNIYLSRYSPRFAVLILVVHVHLIHE